MIFNIGDTVAFKRDFPSLGIKAGDRRVVVSRAKRIPVGKHCRKEIPERYGLLGLEHVRFNVEDLQGCSDNADR